MRIIAGKYKKTILYSINDKKIRPLRDMVRESIFNFLIHSNKILFQFNKINVLDLYSGTGSFGLECLSRNAKKVVFIEKEKESIHILKKNIQKLNVEKKTIVKFGDTLDIIKKGTIHLNDDIYELKFDLIFCDPPFKEKNIKKLIELIVQKNLLRKNGIIIIHRHKKSKDELITCIKIVDERVYGISKITFGQSL